MSLKIVAVNPVCMLAHTHATLTLRKVFAATTCSSTHQRSILRTYYIPRMALEHNPALTLDFSLHLRPALHRPPWQSRR